MTSGNQSASLAKGALAGLLGGLAASFAMNYFMPAGEGIPYGIALWVAGDEIAVPAFGLAPKPWQQPKEAHAAMFASHVVYGLALEMTRRTVRNAVA